MSKKKKKNENYNSEVSESRTSSENINLGGEESSAQKKGRERRENFWKFRVLPLLFIWIIFTIYLRYNNAVNIPWVLLAGFNLALLLTILYLGGIIKSRWTAILGTALAMIPQYYVRSSYDLYFPLSTKFGTYPGDLWYCWSYYLDRGFAYPREYPSGIQMIFRFIFRFKPPTLKYEGYFIGICVFLGVFALLVTYILHHIVSETHKKTIKIWIFWILAPTFLWYGLLNMDLMSLFTVVMAYFLFTEDEYYMSSAMLALGAAAKVFPFFLAPLFFFQCPKREYSPERIENLSNLLKVRLKFIPSFISNMILGFLSAKKGISHFLVTWRFRFFSVLVFVFVWFAFNVPFMVKEWDAWKYPYEWQIKHNYAKSTKDGSYFWVIHNVLNYAEDKMDRKLSRDGIAWKIHKKMTPYKEHMGKISLIMFAFLYFIFLKYRWNLPFARRCAGVILLFLLTDRIYSPQYNLYLLPFLVLVDYQFEKPIQNFLFMTAFYLVGILSCSQTIFLFKIREIFLYTINVKPFNPLELPVLFQGVVFLKYLLLIYLFIVNWTAPVNPDSVNWKDGSGKSLEEENIDTADASVVPSMMSP